MTTETKMPLTREITVQYGNRKGDILHTMSHWVWDAEKFMQYLHEECTKNAAKSNCDDETVTQAQQIF